MRLLGYILLLGGFLTFLWVFVDVSMFTYAWWILQRNQLHGVTHLDPDSVSSSIRDVSLRFNTLIRIMLLPAFAMLAGGLILGRKANPKKEMHKSP